MDTEDGSITRTMLATPPPHEPGLLPAWIAEQKVTDVIAGGMGQRAISLFHQHRVNVFVGARVEKPEELARELVNGQLESGANYCDH